GHGWGKTGEAQGRQRNRGYGIRPSDAYLALVSKEALESSGRIGSRLCDMQTIGQGGRRRQHEDEGHPCCDDGSKYSRNRRDRNRAEADRSTLHEDRQEAWHSATEYQRRWDFALALFDWRIWICPRPRSALSAVA